MTSEKVPNLSACKTLIPVHLPPSLEQRLSRLWTVSIISCCCLCRAVLFPVARLSWASSSLITPLCLPTRVWRLPFSCFSVSSSSWCRISISNIFCSRRLGERKKGQEKFVMKDGKVVLCYYPSLVCLHLKTIPQLVIWKHKYKNERRMSVALVAM